ncbi:MAG: ATP-binding protein [Nitrososphaeraceae archaeon]
MNQIEEHHHNVFTNLDGKFEGRLSAVIPTKITSTSENAPVSSKYDCRIKVEYHKDIMRLLEEGMILAVRNFKSKFEDNSEYNTQERFTLLVISRIWPDHYGLRGLSDSTYYPMQFEVIEQSVTDWDTDDRSTMMIQISSIPVNYDLVLDRKDSYEFKKGFSYPIIGDKVFLLNPNTIRNMYNKNIVDELKNNGKINNIYDYTIGHIKMFDNFNEIPIFLSYDNMIRYHFGIFAFTGGGKSNLLSNILRKILYENNKTKIVIFDISSEYPFLLIDIFANSKIRSKIILEERVKNSNEFYTNIVKPREYEEDERTKKSFSKIFNEGIVSYYVEPDDIAPTFQQIFNELDQLKSDSIGKPHYINAINSLQRYIKKYVKEKKITESDYIDETFKEYLSNVALTIMKKFHVHDKSGLFSWSLGISSLLENVDDYKNKKKYDGLTTDQIVNTINNESRLTCISISDPYKLKKLIININKKILRKRKRQFQVRPYILFVFDEAQEFVGDLSNSRGIDKECSIEVETLLRQGRKFGLGGCIATQRIAYLNTSALQQLHTYFIGTLPRPYDRNVISNTFTIDQGILEKTLEFAPGQWLLSSYIATGMDNVPIFIKADNSEKDIEEFINKNK